jgi:hypothetical protein
LFFDTISGMDRRELLKTLAVAPVLAQAQTPAAPMPNADVLARVTDLIIPRSETPGAIDAGVPKLIEARTRRDARFQQRLATGLKDLAAKGFLKLPEAEQVALLESIAATPFFKLIKGATIDAYYSTREGLVEELGWHGSTHLEEFPGCTHPEHKD